MAKGQKTGGRQAGTPNKVQREDRELAKKYGPKAIEELAKLAGLLKDGKGAAEAESVRKGALDSILDRAYGKPVQEIGNEGDKPFRVVTRIELVGPNG